MKPKRTNSPQKTPNEQPSKSSEHDNLIKRLLDDPKQSEAIKWLKSAKRLNTRTIGGCGTNRDSIKLVQQLYDKGAVEVIAVNIHEDPKRNGDRTGKLVAVLPKDAKKRKAIFDWCKAQGDSLGFSPSSDNAESHLFLLLD